MRRALVATGPEGGATVSLQTKPELSPEGKDLIIRPLYVGLCGTDLELIGGLLPPQYTNYPLVIGEYYNTPMAFCQANKYHVVRCVGHTLTSKLVANYHLRAGHEWSGEVIRIGSEVTQDFALGEHVVVAGLVPCMSCPRCLSGDTNICTTYQEIGSVRSCTGISDNFDEHLNHTSFWRFSSSPRLTRDGGASDEVLIPASQAHRLGPHVSPLDAAMCEPCAVVQRALLQAKPKEGSRILVVGDGAVALLCCHLAKLTRPASITMLGKRREQESLAKVVGVSTFTTDSNEVVGGYDLVMEAAGTTDAVATAISAAGRGGTVVLIGIPPDGDTAAIPISQVVYNDLKVSPHHVTFFRGWFFQGDD